jgi:hypothetical protein
MLDGTWRDLFRAAIIELNPGLRKIRVKVAADAIKARASDTGVTIQERRELGDALAMLRRLKPEEHESHVRWSS